MKWSKNIIIFFIGLMTMAVDVQYQPNVIWKPQEGSQELFLSCPIFECCYEGTRGPGKTDALLMDFAQYVGRGHGPAWSGVLFRREYKELQDVVKKSKKWFRQIFPTAKFLESKSDYKWVFADGEELLFRTAKVPDDYWNYHGHEYPWIGWEELTNWPNDELYLTMMSVCRSSHPNMPRHYRSTCNPYGVGHNWVKARFIDPAPRGTIITDEEGRERVCLHGSIWENKILLENDPDYLKNLQAQTGARREAWLHGNWDIVAGGMFDDVWDRNVHILKPFDIPDSWKLDRSFDWGSSKPYSVGYWAESDGCDITLADGKKKSTIRGDLFRIAEIYGCTGKPNEGLKETASEIAEKIKKYESDVLKRRVYAGPADTSIYDKQDGNCIADNMAKKGVYWTKANKKAGSRVSGWELLRERLKSSIPNSEGAREESGLFVFSNCRDFIRTVPVLPRDGHNPDDIDTDAEDHIADEVRYRISKKKHITTSESMG